MGIPVLIWGYLNPRFEMGIIQSLTHLQTGFITNREKGRASPNCNKMQIRDPVLKRGSPFWNEDPHFKTGRDLWKLQNGESPFANGARYKTGTNIYVGHRIRKTPIALMGSPIWKWKGIPAQTKYGSPQIGLGIAFLAFSSVAHRYAPPHLF
jgi:hypothetical protein